MTQEVLHSKVANIEQETHIINNRQIFIYVTAIIMAAFAVAGWWFVQRQSILDERSANNQNSESIKQLIRENHLKDSMNFIQLNDKIDKNHDLTDQRLRVLEDKATRKIFKVGYVNEQYKHGRSGLPTFNPMN